MDVIYVLHYERYIALSETNSFRTQKLKSLKQKIMFLKIKQATVQSRIPMVRIGQTDMLPVQILCHKKFANMY
jgi:hypothetical protein